MEILARHGLNGMSKKPFCSKKLKVSIQTSDLYFKYLSKRVASFGLVTNQGTRSEIFSERKGSPKSKKLFSKK